MALFIPFLDTIGLRPNSVISWGTRMTFLTIIIGATWVVSIWVGCLRKHEDALVCFFDSIGIPGVIGTLIYAAKVFGSI
jgi:hypothetical protein